MWFIEALVFLLLVRVSSVASEDDTQCLQQVKSSLKDNQNFFYNWNFANSTAKAYLCNFNGVTCWNQQENKVLSLKFGQGGLSGQFPKGLVNCKSLQGLDLSQNSLSGSIPTDICNEMPTLTNLLLSNNEFSGLIPDNVGNCAYLNQLHLDHNNLTGTIPWEIGILPRLTDLDLSSNELEGQIPGSLTNRTAFLQEPFPATAFQDNPGLCGPPLPKSCGSSEHQSISRILVPLAGFGVFAVIFVLTVWWVFCRARCYER